MTPQTINIDLGDLSTSYPSTDPAPWPSWWYRYRRYVSTALAALIAAATLGLTTGATPRELPSLAAQFSVTGSDVFWDDRHIYTVDRLGRPDPTVTAHRLTDGALAWQVQLPGFFYTAWQFMEDDALLLYGSSRPGEAQGLDDLILLRLEPDTGEIRWTIPGSLRQAAGRHLLVQRQHVAGDPLLADSEGGMVLTVVDATTGADLWELRLAGWNMLVDQHGSGRLLTLDRHYRLTSYDLSTGRRLASVVLADPPTDPAAAMEALELVSAWDGIGFIRQTGPYGYTLTGYDTTTLQTLWTLERSGPGYQDGAGPWPQECGELLCLIEPDGIPRALDPRTGAVVWTADWLRDHLEESGDPPGINDAAALGGHLLISVSRQPWLSSWVVDAATGQPVAYLGGWVLAPVWNAAPGEPVLAVLVPSDALTGGGAAPREFWIGRLLPDVGRVAPVAVIRERSGGCVPGRHEYFMCYRERSGGSRTATVNVWHVG